MDVTVERRFALLDPRLLQLCDSAFPSGAFSHSFGLETAILERDVRDASGVRAWMCAYLGESLATLDARAIVLALRGAEIDALDAWLGASIFAVEARAANRRLARATLDAYATMGLDDAGARAYREAIGAERAHGIHALAVALGYRAIGAAPGDAVCGFLSAAAAALGAVAARAIPLGQRDVGALLWSLREPIRTWTAHALEVETMDDLTMSAIPCEIDAMRHASLDGRLFAS
jgi:urease accessory protein